MTSKISYAGKKGQESYVKSNWKGRPELRLAKRDFHHLHLKGLRSLRRQVRSQESHSLRPILSMLRNKKIIFCVYQISMLKTIVLVCMAKKQVLQRARRRLCTS